MWKTAECLKFRVCLGDSGLFGIYFQAAFCHESCLLQQAKCPSTSMSHDEVSLSKKLSRRYVRHSGQGHQLNVWQCKCATRRTLNWAKQGTLIYN